MDRRGLLLLWALLSLLAFVLPGWLTSSGAGEMPVRSPRTLTYEIDARLDAAEHVVAATGTLTWRNDARVAAEEMRFHLYLNAFRDRMSVFMRESYGSWRLEDLDETQVGSIELTRLVRGGRDLLAGAHPDLEEPEDGTVLVVPLTEPIPPGGEATFELAWTSRLPRVVARAGWGGPFHMVTQWYPKPGVLTPQGWICPAYHASSEFFADYGVYRVRLTVPLAYAGRVGATGVCTNPEGAVHEDGSVTYAFEADDVHDFAWTCDDDFVVREYAFAGGDGTAPQERARMTEILEHDPGPLPPVTVRLLLQPEHADLALRHRDAAFHALSCMGHWFGAYPYPVLTIVDPDHRAGGAGGMEYPTLITAGCGYVVDDDGWSPELVVVHEFGHQHFYGLVGTNEFEDAWMDEGFTTWATARVMERVYGPRPATTWYAGLPVRGERPLPFGGWLAEAPEAMPWVVRVLKDDVDLPLVGALWPDHGEATPLSYLREVPSLTLLRPSPLTVSAHERARLAESDLVDPVIGCWAWKHMDGRSYRANSYFRTSAALRTLEAEVGEARMLRLLRTYCERHRFGHPTPEDLVAVWREVLPDVDPGRFLGALLRETGHVDYGVETVRDLGDEPGAGQEVLLRRYGTLAPLPVDVLVRFEDGSTRRLCWQPDGALTAADGGEVPPLRVPSSSEQGRWLGVRFTGGEGRRVVSAEVDPDHRLFQERDRTNDGRRAAVGERPSVRVAIRALGWVEMTTSFYGGL